MMKTERIMFELLIFLVLKMAKKFEPKFLTFTLYNLGNNQIKISVSIVFNKF